MRRLVGVAVLVVLAAACGGGGGAQGNPGELFPDRPNQYREDQEREIGDTALLSGYTTTVTDASYDAGAGTVTVSVRIENRDDEPVTGELTFVVDDLEPRGDYYIVYKPEDLDAARGIWQLTVG